MPEVASPAAVIARLGGDDLVGRLGLDAEMVDRARLGIGTLEHHELERRIGDLPVGVARLDLVRLGVEHAGVEVDGFVEIGDVESELQAHGWFLRG